MQYQLSELVSVYGGVYNLLDKEVDSDTYGRVLDGRRYNAGITLRF